ncbi:MAG: hypothetical protein KGJ87_09185 [Planctomycetota bacterium]|nr:hypothetical protein [Planctomycetota bacterium]
MAKEKIDKNETKADKFRRIATKRTLRLLEDLRLLGNCANHGTYSYTEDDIDKIFLTVEKELKRVKFLFKKPKINFELK